MEFRRIPVLCVQSVYGKGRKRPARCGRLELLLGRAERNLAYERNRVRHTGGRGLPEPCRRLLRWTGRKPGDVDVARPSS